MQFKSLIKAGLMTATLATLATPALAQPGRGDDGARGDRRGTPRSEAYPSRGRGNEGGGGRESRGERGDNGGQNRSDRGDNSGGSGGREYRAAPAQSAAPAAAPAPQASPARTNAPRPGTREWYAERGVNAPQAQPQQQPGQAASNQGRGRDDRDGRDGRGGGWNGNDRDGRDGRDGNWRGNDRGRDGRDNNWRDNDRNGDRNWSNNGSGRDWRYTPGRRVENRWDGLRRWDNDWRRDRRYDWQSWRNSNRNLFRLPRYSAPYGWTRGYSRFSIGIYLNSILFGTSYWIDDPWRYRLPPAYGPFRWVRYYDDALLVDIRDGYVVDVIHGVFW